jgi:hypothetical protein
VLVACWVLSALAGVVARSGVEAHIGRRATRGLSGGEGRGGDGELGSVVADEAPVELRAVLPVDLDCIGVISSGWRRSLLGASDGIGVGRLIRR